MRVHQYLKLLATTICLVLCVLYFDTFVQFCYQCTNFGPNGFYPSGFNEVIVGDIFTVQDKYISFACFLHQFILNILLY